MEESEIDIRDYYTFVTNPVDEQKGAVQITKGPFEGMIYTYDEYKFVKVDEETGTPSVKFSFNVISIPETMAGVTYPDEMKESFNFLLRDILVDIVAKDVVKSARLDYDGANREGDFDESFERRVFYENDVSVFEE